MKPAFWATLAIATPAISQSVDAPRTWIDRGMFVTEGDITNCPYRTVGRVEANVHPATIFSKRPDLKKVVGEMRERAVKMHADAIVKSSFGAEHATMVWARVVTGIGQAVQFVSPCPTPEAKR